MIICKYAECGTTSRTVDVEPNVTYVTNLSRHQEGDAITKKVEVVLKYTNKRGITCEKQKIIHLFYYTSL